MNARRTARTKRRTTASEQGLVEEREESGIFEAERDERLLAERMGRAPKRLPGKPRASGRRSSARR